MLRRSHAALLLQADYSRVIALDPTNAHAYHNRGISHDKSGAYESAVADFSKVLELDASNANALFNRGSTHDSMGRYEEAIVSGRQSVQARRQRENRLSPELSILIHVGCFPYFHSLLALFPLLRLPCSATTRRRWSWTAASQQRRQRTVVHQQPLHRALRRQQRRPDLAAAVAGQSAFQLAWQRPGKPVAAAVVVALAQRCEGLMAGL